MPTISPDQRIPKGNSTTTYGTFNGQPAKICYYPERKQVVVYYGGYGPVDSEKPALFHSHLVISDADPTHVQYHRVGNRITSDPRDIKDQKKRVGWEIAELLLDSWRRARRWWGI